MRNQVLRHMGSHRPVGRLPHLTGTNPHDANPHLGGVQPESTPRAPPRDENPHLGGVPPEPNPRAPPRDANPHLGGVQSEPTPRAPPRDENPHLGGVQPEPTPSTPRPDGTTGTELVTTDSWRVTMGQQRERTQRRLDVIENTLAEGLGGSQGSGGAERSDAATPDGMGHPRTQCAQPGGPPTNEHTGSTSEGPKRVHHAPQGGERSAPQCTTP